MSVLSSRYKVSTVKDDSQPFKPVLQREYVSYMIIKRNPYSGYSERADRCDVNDAKND